MLDLKALLAVAAVALAPGLASAAIVLDDFSVDQTVADAAIGPIPTSNTVGNRTFTVDNRAAVAPFDASLVSGGLADLLAFNNQSGVEGLATVDWTFAGLDLSTKGYFQIDLLSFDLVDEAALLGMTVDGVTASRSIGFGDIGTIAFSFSDFAGVDFANVTSLSLFIDAAGAPSLDASFDNLRVAPVPLPAAGLLLLGSLGVLGAVKRRRS